MPSVILTQSLPATLRAPAPVSLARCLSSTAPRLGLRRSQARLLPGVRQISRYLSWPPRLREPRHISSLRGHDFFSQCAHIPVHVVSLSDQPSSISPCNTIRRRAGNLASASTEIEGWIGNVQSLTTVTPRRRRSARFERAAESTRHRHLQKAHAAPSRARASAYVNVVCATRGSSTGWVKPYAPGRTRPCAPRDCSCRADIGGRLQSERDDMSAKITAKLRHVLVVGVEYGSSACGSDAN